MCNMKYRYMVLKHGTWQIRVKYLHFLGVHCLLIKCLTFLASRIIYINIWGRTLKQEARPPSHPRLGIASTVDYTVAHRPGPTIQIIGKNKGVS